MQRGCLRLRYGHSHKVHEGSLGVGTSCDSSLLVGCLVDEGAVSEPSPRQAIKAITPARHGMMRWATCYISARRSRGEGVPQHMPPPRTGGDKKKLWHEPSHSIQRWNKIASVQVRPTIMGALYLFLAYCFWPTGQASSTIATDELLFPTVP